MLWSVLLKLQMMIVKLFLGSHTTCQHNSNVGNTVGDNDVIQMVVDGGTGLQ